MLENKEKRERRKKDIRLFRTGDFSDAEFFAPNIGRLLLLGAVLFIVLVIGVIIRRTT